MNLKHTYFKTYTALIALLVVTYVLAFVHLGSLNLLISLSIAFAKFALIAVIFMDLRRSESVTRIYACVGGFWLGILLVLAMSDVLTRNWLELPSRWPH